MGDVMNKPAFTPWHCDSERPYQIKSNGNRIASCNTALQYSTNARLIAAAPDMYEALRLAEEHFGGPFVNLDLTDKDYEVLKTIRAALAKVQP